MRGPDLREAILVTNWVERFQSSTLETSKKRCGAHVRNRTRAENGTKERALTGSRCHSGTYGVDDAAPLSEFRTVPYILRAFENPQLPHNCCSARDGVYLAL